MSNRWDEGAIEYSELDKLREVLVGRSIVSVNHSGLDTFHGEVNLELDNGDVLTAYEVDGGCGCSNGCFNLSPKLSGSSAILGVDLVEQELNYDYDSGDYTPGDAVSPGSIYDGSAIIRLFIYTELGKQELLASEGGDNGYYGWGFHLFLKKKENN